MRKNLIFLSLMVLMKLIIRSCVLVWVMNIKGTITNLLRE